MPRIAVRPEQSVLPLDWSADGSNDPPLISGACNSDALRLLAAHGDWAVRCAVLVGPAKSGRSLIGRTFVRASGGQMVDGPFSLDEEALFHAWNKAQTTGKPLLILADEPPGQWPIALADLRSRLAAVPVARIGAPDDDYARDYITTHFALRGMAVSPDVTDFIVRRMHRSHAALAAVVATLDAASLAQGRRIGKRLAAEVLRQQGLIEDDLVDRTGASQ